MSSEQNENTEDSHVADSALLQENTGSKPIAKPPTYVYGLFSGEQLLAMVIYPVTLLLGQIVVFTSPEASYFSDKKNIFNIVFVKKGWLWTTVAFVANTYYLLTSRNGKIASASKVTVLRQAIARYVVATLWWIVFAQWLFGMPLMDRVFLWTGGSCDSISKNSTMLNLVEIGPGPHRHLSSAVCRAHGGSWLGGYDPSGHIFILTHGSLFMWFETLPILTGRRVESPIPLPIKIVLGFLLFWWWMFLMTSVYFHSFGEKVAGLILGYVEVTAIYIICEHLPVGKQLFGHQ